MKYYQNLQDQLNEFRDDYAVDSDELFHMLCKYMLNAKWDKPVHVHIAHILDALTSEILNLETIKE